MSDSSGVASAQKSNSTSGGTESNSAFADAVQRARQLAAKIHSTGSDSGSVAVGGVKRPLEDSMNGVTDFPFSDGSPEIKKMATNDPYGSTQVTSVQRNGADFVIEEYKVPDKMVGLIIGKGGEQILRLQAETGCKIQLAPDSGGAPDRPCTLTGSRDSVQRVKVMITQIIAKANSPFPPDTGHDGQYTAEMMIPGPKVGLLIGKGGENIKNLQEKGGVKMVLIQDGPQQTLHEKPLRISGDPQKVEFAKQMVIDLLAQKDLERFANGAGAQEELMVPRQAVGVVIGKSGEMIKRIQNDSGARVQFIQGKEDIPGDKLCQITGHPDQVQKAASMIQELIQSVLMEGGNEPRGGGGRGGGGRGRGRGMGGPGMRPGFGPGGPRMRGPNDGPATEIQFPVPANKCGLVIGKGGETVRAINQQSGAHVEISRGAQPNPHEKLFIIRGSPQQIEHAKQLISERIGMPPQGGPPGGPPQGGPPNQFQPQYPQQFQQPGGPGQPYGAPNWGNPYQQWPNQPASAGVAVAPNDPTKVSVDPNAAAWAAYYAQFYGQQPQPGQMQPTQQPQPGTAGTPSSAPAGAPAATTSGGQPDYSAAWAEYYRSLGMYREAEMIEQQARTNQTGQPAPSAAPGTAPAMGQPAPVGAPQQQPGAPPQSLTPAGTPAPAGAGGAYPGVYPQPGQQPQPGQVPYGGGYPGYNYAPYGAQQQFAAPAQQ